MSELTKKMGRLNFKHTVLVDQVSDTIAQAILEGILKGGDQLVEAKLQEQFGISRSPLREAFRDLEKKGLVVIVPRKGTFVKRVTRKDIEDNFPVRAVLEGLAAREAFSRMTKEELDSLEETFLNMKGAVAKKDGKAFMKHHIKFHEGFIRASGNDVLINILMNLRMHSVWHRFSYQYYKEDFQRSLIIHKKILDLFRNEDSDAQEIENMVRWHIEIALDRFLAYLEEQQSKPR
nr:GntR family transcriptional regulator [Desulfobacterales bacterium]